MKKRVLIIAGIITVAVIVILAGIPVKRWIDDQNRRYMIHPYIVYDGTVYIDDGYTAHPEIREEGYTETDAVITNLVDGNVLSEEEGTTNVKGYLNGVVYVNDQYPDMIYLRLSGGEDDGKYARFYAPDETNS